MNPETLLSNAIRDAVSQTGKATLYRNTVGFDMRAVARYGLAKGSADLVGFVHGHVFDDGMARFFALEVKLLGSPVTREQSAWNRFVRSKGAGAFIVHSVPEALAALEDLCRPKP